MRRIALALLAVSSLLACTRESAAAVRPHYGGTLRVLTRAAPASLDPVSGSNQLAERNIIGLIFDTVIRIDDHGRPQPWLGSSWHADSNAQHWQITIRRGIKFQDGSDLTADAVASSLQFANAKWRVSGRGDSVTIETEAPDPNVPAELALSQNSIAKRGPQLVGTGPFAISSWQPASKLTLTAFEDYWAGRPFVDSIEIQMGKSYRDQVLELDANAADLIEVAPEQARRTAAEGRSIESSVPSELMALVFSHEAPSEDEGKLREALGHAIDREALNSLLLQGEGVPSASLLPDWLSGYGFLFPITPDLARARQLRGLIPAATWTMSYDTTDPLSRVVAERIILNAQDVGLRLQVAKTGTADVQLVRVPVKSLDPEIALEHLIGDLQLGAPQVTGQTPQAQYELEARILQSHRVIPVLHIPSVVAISGAVKNWTERRDGLWRLENVWLEKP